MNAPELPTELSPKQSKVVLLAMQDKTPEQIAKRMKITTNGVYGHMRKIREKGLAHLLEQTPAIPPSSDNGSSQNGQPTSQAIERLHTQIKEAIGTAEERLQEIDSRRGEIADQTKALSVEDSELAAESEQLSSERDKLIAV